MPDLYTKPVNWLTIGDVLAEDIIIDHEVIFTAGTVITLNKILKLQSLEIAYVKVSSTPFATANYQKQTNIFSDLIAQDFYNFLIKNNKNQRYSILLKDNEDFQFVTNHALLNMNESVVNLLSALKSWDNCSYKHVLDVFVIAAQWMRYLGMTVSANDCYGLLLHDIGKIKVPRSILIKNQSLTNEEYEYIKMHTENGDCILKSLNFPNIVCDMAKFHHVRFNGTGYPKTYPEVLDIRVKMLMIVDVFSALTLDRPYRKAYSFEDGLDILKMEADGFDKDLLQHFINFIKYKMEKIPQR